MRNPLPRRGHNELFRKKLLSPGAAPQQVDRVSAQTRQPLPHLDRLPNSGNLGNETAGPNRATGRVRHQAVEIVVVATGVARSDRSVPVSVYHRTRATRARSRRTGSAAFWHANAGRTNKVSASGPILVRAQN